MSEQFLLRHRCLGNYVLGQQLPAASPLALKRLTSKQHSDHFPYGNNINTLNVCDDSRIGPERATRKQTLRAMGNSTKSVV